MRFFQPHQYLSLDFARQDLLLIDVTAAAGLDLAQLAALASASTALPNPVALGGQPAPGMSLCKVPVEPGEPLRLEIESFLDAVRRRVQPQVTVEDGRAALALALQIDEAIALHARRTGL
jgi:predicted dehydrogenase